MNSVLSIKNLSKSYRHNWTFKLKPILKGINIEVNKADVFAFLGQNGEGKTTTIKCILGLCKQYQGEIHINGCLRLASGLNKEIGYLPELPYFYEHLSVQETMEFFADLYCINKTKAKERIAHLIDKIGLTEHKKKLTTELSKGLKQKLGFIQAILNYPELLILDEPFSGLDPIARTEMKQLVMELSSQGTTIFMSSHILSDVEEICNKACILKNGVIKKEIQLKSLEENKKYLLKFELNVDLIRQLSFHNDVINYSDEEILTVEFNNYSQAEKALQELLHHKAKVHSLNSVNKSLEEIYIAINREHKAK